MDIEVQTELVAGLPVTVLSGNGYDRIVVRERKLNVSSEANDDYVQRTIAYVSPAKRNGGVKLDFAAKDVAPLPKTRTKSIVFRGDRAVLMVDGKNVAKARALLEKVAEQAGA